VAVGGDQAVDSESTSPSEGQRDYLSSSPLADIRISDHARTTVSGGVTRSAVERLVRGRAITQLLIGPVALVSGNARMLTRSPFGSATMKCLMPKTSSRRSSAIRKPSFTAVAYAASTSST